MVSLVLTCENIGPAVMTNTTPPYGIQRLHHFTDARNLRSISEHGLLSARERISQVILPVAGGDERSCELDVAYGLDAYVHLSLTPYHPMQYVATEEGRICEVVDIMVNPEILSRPGVMMTLDVANKQGGSALLPVAGWIASVDVGLIYRPLHSLTSKQHDRVRHLRKMEILVPTEVPASMLHYDLGRARGR